MGSAISGAVVLLALAACGGNDTAGAAIADTTVPTADTADTATPDVIPEPVEDTVVPTPDAGTPPADTNPSPADTNTAPDILLPAPQIGPPCSVAAMPGMTPTPGQTPWPAVMAGQLLKVNSLTSVIYEPSATQTPNAAWGVSKWWMLKGNDPWSEYPYWGNDYVMPDHVFEDDHLRWKCGYSYVVEIPEGYDPNQSYPVVIFLHGSADLDGETLNWYHNALRKSFHRPAADPYVYVAPIKLEIDWDAKKVQDVLEDVKANLPVNTDRIYLTGLSMGGRGTFIVAAELTDAFAAILPLSPHHAPYSYVPLAEKVAHLPTWLMHGVVDAISSFDMAVAMAAALTQAGATVEFHTLWGPWTAVGHWGWEHIYSDAAILEWILAWEKPSPP